jgi:8-oxo-dGTP pyrophosphatase MutT (NUDIX family)
MTWEEVVSRLWISKPLGYVPFLIEGRMVGRIAPRLESCLLSFPSLVSRIDKGWALVDEVPGFHRVTEALGRISEELARRRLIPALTGELYSIVTRDDPGMEVGRIDRSAAIAFGIAFRGVHLNAYVPTAKGTIGMWLARRSKTSHSFPGKLDNLVAGGLSAGMTPSTVLQKEASEEAGIEAELILMAKQVCRMNYLLDTDVGFVDGTMEVFELELPATFKPKNQDSSVEGFLLCDLRLLEHLILKDALKPNCALVAFDFLLRRGWMRLSAELTRSKLAHIYKEISHGD